jgi:hypothetical protein
MLWATGRNNRVDQGAWPSPWLGRPGGSCHLGALVRAHGRGHTTRDRRGGMAGAARQWHVGRQGPRESIIEERASRRAWKRGGELAIGVA